MVTYILTSPLLLGDDTHDDANIFILSAQHEHYR